MPQEAQIPQAAEAQGNLVLLAVAVGVLGLEGPQHLRQLLGGGGLGQAQGLQPGSVDPHGVVVLQLVDAGQRHNGAVGQGNGLEPVRMLLQHGPQVGGVLLQIRLQVDQHALFVHLQLLRVAQASLEQHLGQLHNAVDHALLGLGPGVLVRILAEHERKALLLFHPLEEVVGIPVMVGGLIIEAGHGIHRQVLSHRGAGQEQHGHKQKPCHHLAHPHHSLEE